MPARPFRFLFLVTVLLTLSFGAAVTAAAEETEQETLKVLFIGNSYTARHNLAQVVKQMAEAGNPGLTFEPTTVIYGGRRLVDHWRLGSQNFVKLHELTRAEEEATLAKLKAAAQDPENREQPESEAELEEALDNRDSAIDEHIEALLERAARANNSAEPDSPAVAHDHDTNESNNE